MSHSFADMQPNLTFSWSLLLEHLFCCTNKWDKTQYLLLEFYFLAVAFELFLKNCIYLLFLISFFNLFPFSSIFFPPTCFFMLLLRLFCFRLAPRGHRSKMAFQHCALCSDVAGGRYISRGYCTLTRRRRRLSIVNTRIWLTRGVEGKTTPTTTWGTSYSSYQVPVKLTESPLGVFTGTMRFSSFC